LVNAVTPITFLPGLALAIHAMPIIKTTTAFLKDFIDPLILINVG
jgi:hypothetical protein